MVALVRPVRLSRSQIVYTTVPLVACRSTSGDQEQAQAMTDLDAITTRMQVCGAFGEASARLFRGK